MIFHSFKGFVHSYRKRVHCRQSVTVPIAPQFCVPKTAPPAGLRTLTPSSEQMTCLPLTMDPTTTEWQQNKRQRMRLRAFIVVVIGSYGCRKGCCRIVRALFRLCFFAVFSGVRKNKDRRHDQQGGCKKPLEFLECFHRSLVLSGTGFRPAVPIVISRVKLSVA